MTTSNRTGRWWGTTRARLYLFGTLACVLIIVVGVLGERGLARAEAAARLAHQQRLVPLADLAQMMELLMDGRIQLLNAARDGTTEGINKRVVRVEEHMTTMQSRWDSLQPSLHGDSGAALIRQFQQAFLAYDSDGVRPAIRALRAQDIELANKVLNNQLYTLYKPVRDTIKATIAHLRSESEQEYQASATRSASVRWMVIVAILAAVGVSILVLSRVAGHIASALRNLREASALVAQGDLTYRVPVRGRDDLAAVALDFNRMVEGMAGMIQTVTGTVSTLVQTGAGLNQTIHDTRAAIHRQQSNTDQVASAIHQMAATVREVAVSAARATTAADSANDHVRQGREVVSITIKGINTLAEQIKDVSQAITRLGDDSQEIGKVLVVIRGIAEQTNLLALNAAIEAARAGEQGRGFAVVADEVRTLASRTQDSTREIEAMIERLQAGVQQASQAMTRSVTHSDENVQRASQAGGALDAITTAMRTMADMNTQIASAAEQQGVAAEEINRTVTGIADEAQHTADGAEAMAQVSDQLSQLANQLDAAASHFRLTGGS